LGRDLIYTSSGILYSIKQDGQYTYDVTMTRIPVIIVAIEKQEVLNIMSV
jgi:hypothetical protein